MSQIGILTSWKVYINPNGEYYISNTQYLYLEYLTKNFDTVFLICPLYKDTILSTGLKKIGFKNLMFLSLPSYKGYIQSLKYYRSFKSQIKKIIDKVDFFYVTAPDPFCWLPIIMKKNPENRIHFVSDIIEVTKTNIKLNPLKKWIYILGYLPEYFMTLYASKKSKVFVNGVPLTKKIKKMGVGSTSVVSSTIRKCDVLELNEFKDREKNMQSMSFLYVGYLRNSKGLDTLMDFILILVSNNENFSFNIVGIGDMFDELDDFIKKHKLDDKVNLLGRIDNREKLYNLMKNSDLFFFPSLSEGSPRVVIEAMSQGLPVLSTPVGSLPSTFVDGNEILFFDFKDASKAYLQVIKCKKNPELLNKIALNAHKRIIDDFTIEQFLDKIFKNTIK